MKRNFIKVTLSGTALMAALGLVACGDTDSKSTAVIPESAELFANSGVSIDSKNFVLEITKAKDSLVIESLGELGGVSYYLALDGDLVDPAIDWDNPLETGSVIKKGEAGYDNIVVMDEKDRIVGVWQIKYPKKSSSSTKTESSSSSQDSSSSLEEGASCSSSTTESSSSETVVESSSSNEAVAESSSSDENTISSSSSEPVVEPVSSSETVIESSSSEEELVSSSSVETAEISSSSETVVESSSSVEQEPESSSSEESIISSSSEEVPAILKASELTISDGQISIDDDKIYVEMPYGSDLTKLKFDQLDTANDLTRSVEMELANDLGEKISYSVKAGVQLPGSDFSKRDDSFWGTTSDAMAIAGRGKYKVPFLGITVDVSMRSDSANAYFDDGRMILITQAVVGHSTGFDGGWKMAGGFYFAGSYSGVDGASLYQADNDEAGADNCAADFSQYMEHGRPFMARPVSFQVDYSYEHRKNTNTTYPQFTLIYVALVSADNKVVAAGSVSDQESVEDASRLVELKYGDDAGLLGGSVVGLEGLTLGTGSEDVASIRVMFASSSLAFIADGGSSSQMNKNFRGGEGSKLIVDNFKLNY